VAVKIKPRSRKFDDVELASLQLAFLKENYRYRKFIEKNRDRVLSAYREWRSAVQGGRAPKIPSVNRLGKEISPEDLPMGVFGGGFILPLDGSPALKIPGQLPITDVHVWFHKRMEEDFGVVNFPFNVSMRAAGGRREVLTPEESLDLLDPMKDIESVPNERREAALRIMFSARGIRQVVHIADAAIFRREVPYFCDQQTINNNEDDGEVSEEASISVFDLEQREKQQRLFQITSDEELEKKPPQWFKGKLSPYPLSALLPHERLLIVDLRKKKSELLKEFGAYFEEVIHHRKYTKDSEWKRSYSWWKLDTKRSREEARRHLEVWKLRRQRKGYAKIAMVMRMKTDAVKKSFYRAFELIEGRIYQPESFRQSYWEIKKEELRRICATCPDHPNKGGSCKELCPDVLPFVTQDKKSSSGKLLSDYLSTDDTPSKSLRPAGHGPDGHDLDD
jgi:hypothetical protein